MGGFSRQRAGEGGRSAGESTQGFRGQEYGVEDTIRATTAGKLECASAA